MPLGSVVSSIFPIIFEVLKIYFSLQFWGLLYTTHKVVKSNQLLQSFGKEQITNEKSWGINLAVKSRLGPGDLSALAQFLFTYVAQFGSEKPDHFSLLPWWPS